MDKPSNTTLIMHLKDIGSQAHDINAANGWDTSTPAHWPQTEASLDARFLCTHMALIHTEVAEATEAIRHRDRENFVEELADTIIRITSIAHGLGLDLELAVATKLTANRARGFRHGGKEV